jgi:hypothetical protein
MNPKIVFLPHGNLQYSQLPPEKRGWVIKNSYEKIFDLILSNPLYKIGFEASGISLKFMADECPEVMEKMVAAIRIGQIEPVASPYTHIMLSNIDAEIGLYSLIDGLDAWEQYTGVRPVTGWNPECSWTNYIPEIYEKAGFKNLIMDADSLLLSFDEIRKATGLRYDVRSHSNKNKLFLIEQYIKDRPEFLKYITNPSRLSSGLQMIVRSDMMANPMLWYLMGATEGHREKPIEISEIDTMLKAWKERISQSGSFIMPYAEDAEYIGTSAYFYVKQFNEARFFELVPESVDKFKSMLDLALENGYELSTPAGVINSSTNILENDQVYKVDNGIAWHGGTAKAWANTSYSRVLDPVCNDLLRGIRNICNHLDLNFDTMDEHLKEARMVLTNAWVSDSRWPPLPTSPGRFNVRESLDDLYKANELIGKSMTTNQIDGQKSLHSVELIHSLIASIEEELMGRCILGRSRGIH